MAAAKAVRSRDRRESDLLLSVVFAHMAFGSARSESDRRTAHRHFEEAVSALYRFLKDGGVLAEIDSIGVQKLSRV